MPDIQPGARRAQISWCVFDWANSAFPTVIVTFVFAAYFTSGVAASPEEGTSLWGYALSASGVAIALLSPVLGAIADRKAQRKPWIAVFAAICMICAASLWFVRPDPDWVIVALVLFAVANVAFEVGTVFYNALLPGLVPAERIGRLSGWGWGLGYAGGLCALAVALALFVQPDPSPFGLDRGTAEHVRAVGPLVAVWFALFSVPLFLFVPEGIEKSGLSAMGAARDGLADLWNTLRTLHRHKALARFLIARLLYIDGLNTLFAFGGIYAAGTFGMTLDDIILFGIAMNVTAGLGAVAFAWIDDYLGSKETVLIALVAITALGLPLLLISSVTWFWVLALSLGLFMGPAQAASRSLMARLAPPDKLGEMFGLFALSGKITAFLGPAVLAAVTAAFASQRAGMATVLVFICAGAAILMTVRVRKT